MAGIGAGRSQKGDLLEFHTTVNYFRQVGELDWRLQEVKNARGRNGKCKGWRLCKDEVELSDLPNLQLLETRILLGKTAEARHIDDKGNFPCQLIEIYFSAINILHSLTSENTH